MTTKFDNLVTQTRRTNLRTLIAHFGGPKALGERLGYKGPSFLVQMAGPNPNREITEKSARGFEESLGLEYGWLDKEPGTQPPLVKGTIGLPHQRPPTTPTAVPAAVPTDVNLVTDVIRMVGQVCEEVSLTLPPMKFADVVALAYSDAAETGGKPREAHLRQVIKLMKG